VLAKRRNEETKRCARSASSWRKWLSTIEHHGIGKTANKVRESIIQVFRHLASHIHKHYLATKAENEARSRVLMKARSSLTRHRSLGVWRRNHEMTIRNQEA